MIMERMGMLPTPAPIFSGIAQAEIRSDANLRCHTCSTFLRLAKQPGLGACNLHKYARKGGRVSVTHLPRNLTYRVVRIDEMVHGLNDAKTL